MGAGERIRKFRKARGMTQAQVAQAIGATEGAVRHYEHGDRTPGPEQIAAIADVLASAQLRSATTASKARATRSRSSSVNMSTVLRVSWRAFL